MRRTIIAAAAALSVLSACSSGDDDTASLSRTEADSKVTESTAPSTTVDPNPEDCWGADDADIDAIDASMASSGYHVDKAYPTTQEPYRFVAANIVDADGKTVSKADVWVFKDEVLYAVSGGARDNSDLPDGRGLGVSVDDRLAQLSVACTVSRSDQ